jgi:uncharacterized protein with HEPN domain
VHQRNRKIGLIYEQLAVELGDLDAVYIEQLVRRTHIYTHYSVGVIGAATAGISKDVQGNIPIRPWQKFTDWHGKKAPLRSYANLVDSEDELAAIGMGLYWIGEGYTHG